MWPELGSDLQLWEARSEHCNHEKPKDTRKTAVIILKFEQCGFTPMKCIENADRITNSVDSDQTAS